MTLEELKNAVEANTEGRWNAQGVIDVLSPCVEALEAENARLREALDGLLECWDAFEVSYGNHEEAYYKLAKYARPKWEAARRARAGGNADG